MYCFQGDHPRKADIIQVISTSTCILNKGSCFLVGITDSARSDTLSISHILQVESSASQCRVLKHTSYLSDSRKHKSPFGGRAAASLVDKLLADLAVVAKSRDGTAVAKTQI